MKALARALKILPFLSCLLVLFAACSLRIGDYPLLPAVLLIPVYYWLVYHPHRLPLWSLFILGLIYDSLLGNDLVFTSLLFILSTIGAYYSRPYLHPNNFGLLWGGFALYSFIYLTLYGILLSGGFALVVSWMYGLVLFPLIAWALGLLHLRVQSYE